MVYLQSIWTFSRGYKMRIKHDKTIITMEITIEELAIITNALGRLNTDYCLYKHFSDTWSKLVNL